MYPGWYSRKVVYYIVDRYGHESEWIHTTALFTIFSDHCTEQNISQPRFDHEVVPDCSGKTMHKVWVILNKEKLGLSMTFANVDEGREMVSKYALIRLQKQAKIS